ncbi:hypothetical protein GQF03_05300 [Sneathiella chungangensis]|uniref:GtrA/DPMS transmembrane domain-containing protein n=1 Tax=Sneathiella chungangensis TaxID=1418234 RepID=A0A845MCZ9_9PROT|nr:GtrA family protein [Sneathiella chungangensis]MZR21739.1 hypothetical protein [Sneathiella chungangensis]
MIAEIKVFWSKAWRFIVTGVVSNVLFYLIYLLLLWLSVPYQIAVTICYVLGMLWGYAINKIWSWQDESPILRSATAYILAYGFIYFCHLGFVTFLVEIQQISPHWGGLASVVFLTIPLFMLLDRFVYRSPKARN